MAKITLTRALKERQVLPQRITDKIQELKPVAVVTSGKAPAGYTDKKEFIMEQKGKFQSAQDMITRYTKLEAAIAVANATTNVKIGKDKMTIAEAIKLRGDVQKLKHKMSNQLRLKFQSAKNDMKLAESMLQERLDNMLVQTFGKNAKVDAKDAKAVTDTFTAANKVELIDAIDVKKEIEKITNELDNLETEIDLSLSEINAKTTIDVD